MVMHKDACYDHVMTATTKEHCPTCGKAGLPALKTCARPGCGVEFRIPEGGRRSDSKYHSRACERAANQKAYRQRQKEQAS